MDEMKNVEFVAMQNAGRRFQRMTSTGVLNPNSLMLCRELREFAKGGFPYSQPLLLTGDWKGWFAWNLIARHIIDGGVAVIFAGVGFETDIRDCIERIVGAIDRESPPTLPIVVHEGIFTADEIIERRNDAVASFAIDGHRGTPLTVIINHKDPDLIKLPFRGDPIMFVENERWDSFYGISVDVGIGTLVVDTGSGGPGDRLSFTLDKTSRLITVLGLTNFKVGYADGTVASSTLCHYDPKFRMLDGDYWAKFPLESALRTLESGVRRCESLAQVSAFVTLFMSGTWGKLTEDTLGEEVGFFCSLGKHGLSARSGLSLQTRHFNKQKCASELEEALRWLYKKQLVNVVFPGGGLRRDSGGDVQRKCYRYGIPFTHVRETGVESLEYLRKRDILHNFIQFAMNKTRKELPARLRGMFFFLLMASSYDTKEEGYVVNLNDARYNNFWISEKEWIECKESLRKREFMQKMSGNEYLLMPPAPVPEPLPELPVMSEGAQPAGKRRGRPKGVRNGQGKKCKLLKRKKRKLASV